MILKVAGASTIRDFRPINFANYMYKTISKVLANRLKGVVGEMVGNTQAAFIKGRSILDSVAVAKEVISYLREKDNDGLVFKVDFKKTFDTLDWGFLMSSLEARGFRVNFRGWIAECLSSSRAATLTNGEPSSFSRSKEG